MRAMSTQSSLISGVIKTENDLGTPEPSRASTAFTPSADKELEDIMSGDETNETESPDTLTLSSMGTKSRTASGKSLSSSTPKSGTGDFSSATKSRVDDVDQGVDSKGPLKTSSAIPMLEVSEVRTTSNVSTLPGIPSHTGAGMTPSLSVEDVSRLSRMSMGRSSERKALLSRDTQNEKDKISASSMKTYLGLDARYSDMLPMLDKLDYGLSAVESSSKLSQDAANEDSSASSVSIGCSSSSTEDDIYYISSNVEPTGSSYVKPESISDKTLLSGDDGELKSANECDREDNAIPTIEITQEDHENGEVPVSGSNVPAIFIVRASGDDIPAIAIESASAVGRTESGVTEDPSGGTSASVENMENSVSQNSSIQQDPSSAEMPDTSEDAPKDILQDSNVTEMTSVDTSEDILQDLSVTEKVEPSTSEETRENILHDPNVSEMPEEVELSTSETKPENISQDSSATEMPKKVEPST